MIGLRLGDARGDRADARFETSFTEIGPGLTFFRSWMSCARSSIE